MGVHGCPWVSMGAYGAPMGYSCGVAPSGHITLVGESLWGCWGFGKLDGYPLHWCQLHPLLHWSLWMVTWWISLSHICRYRGARAAKKRDIIFGCSETIVVMVMFLVVMLMQVLVQVANVGTWINICPIFDSNLFSGQSTRMSFMFDFLEFQRYKWTHLIAFYKSCFVKC